MFWSIGGKQLPHSSNGLWAHVMLCHNYYDFMALGTPGERCLRYRQESCKESHGHDDVAIMTGRTMQPEHAVNLHVMP
jgi:hypothetical protein